MGTQPQQPAYTTEEKSIIRSLSNHLAIIIQSHGMPIYIEVTDAGYLYTSKKYISKDNLLGKYNNSVLTMDIYEDITSFGWVPIIDNHRVINSSQKIKIHAPVVTQQTIHLNHLDKAMRRWIRKANRE